MQRLHNWYENLRLMPSYGFQRSRSTKKQFKERAGQPVKPVTSLFGGINITFRLRMKSTFAE
jgi:hypothetical protein